MTSLRWGSNLCQHVRVTRFLLVPDPCHVAILQSPQAKDRRLVLDVPTSLLWENSLGLARFVKVISTTLGCQYQQVAILQTRMVNYHTTGSPERPLWVVRTSKSPESLTFLTSPGSMGPNEGWRGQELKSTLQRRTNFLAQMYTSYMGNIRVCVLLYCCCTQYMYVCDWPWVRDWPWVCDWPWVLQHGWKAYFVSIHSLLHLVKSVILTMSWGMITIFPMDWIFMYHFVIWN